MRHPIAFKLNDFPETRVHFISLDETLANRIQSRNSNKAPAIIAVSDVALLNHMSAGVFDSDDVHLLVRGDWSRTILIVTSPNPPSQPTPENTDSSFFDWVDRETPDLGGLARELLYAIRNEGIEGNLQLEGHRWVNRPLNTFTLAVQTRVKNFQFTLYGGPERFGKSDFIKRDQNGYSRGWVRSREDIEKFVELAVIAYRRKLNR